MKSTVISRCLGMTLFLCTLAPCCSQAAQDAIPELSWRGPLPHEPAAWSVRRLDAADRVAASIRTDCYVVVHHGRMVHSFGDITTPRDIYSMRKSILSILFGMEVERGSIDLDQSLASLEFDDLGGLTRAEKTATVRMLMHSRSGVYHDAAYEMQSQKSLRPARGSHEPGTFWYYNNWDFNALGTIFRQRAGRTVFEALRDDLAQPLQFEDLNLARDTRLLLEPASQHPAYAMKLSARDLARVGLLMARAGRWGEKQLVSPRWVTQSTTPASVVHAGRHGYASMWWVPRSAWPFWKRGEGDVFFAWGNFGQFLLVDRARDVVIVHQADRRKFAANTIADEVISPLLEEILAAYPFRETAAGAAHDAIR